MKKLFWTFLFGDYKYLDMKIQTEQRSLEASKSLPLFFYTLIIVYFQNVKSDL